MFQNAYERDVAHKGIQRPKQKKSCMKACVPRGMFWRLIVAFKVFLI